MVSVHTQKKFTFTFFPPFLELEIHSNSLRVKNLSFMVHLSKFKIK